MRCTNHINATVVLFSHEIELLIYRVGVVRLVCKVSAVQYDAFVMCESRFAEWRYLVRSTTAAAAAAAAQRVDSILRFKVTVTTRVACEFRSRSRVCPFLIYSLRD